MRKCRSNHDWEATFPHLGFFEVSILTVNDNSLGLCLKNRIRRRSRADPVKVGLRLDLPELTSILSANCLVLVLVEGYK